MNRTEIITTLRALLIENELIDDLGLSFQESDLTGLLHFLFSVIEYQEEGSFFEKMDFKDLYDFEELIFYQGKICYPFNPFLIDCAFESPELLLNQMGLSEDDDSEFAQTMHFYLDTLIGINKFYFFKIFEEKNIMFCAEINKRYFTNGVNSIKAKCFTMDTFDLFQYFHTKQDIKVSSNSMYFEAHQSGSGKILFAEEIFDKDDMFEDSDGNKIISEGNMERLRSLYILRYFYTFLEYLNKPTNAIIQKIDKKDASKNKEWILSHSHFYIMDKESINLNDLSNFEASSSIDRQNMSAHARRGHFRVLKNERYKKNIGKRIWIKDTWIGPSSWIGTDKKVYKIIRENDLIKKIKLDEFD